MKRLGPAQEQLPQETAWQDAALFWGYLEAESYAGRWVHDVSPTWALLAENDPIVH